MRRKKSYFDISPDAPAPIVHRVRHRLQFSEVDALAIAWHGNYPRFFEEAHSELMKKIGLSYFDYHRAKLAAPIAQLHTDYFSPLLLDEEFTVQATLHWNDGARLNVEYALFHEDGSLVATGYTVQMFYNVDTREPLILIPDIYEECRKRWRNGEFWREFR